jgi:hypothetical protein
MTYRTDPATLPAIPVSWTDISWRNDMCPSFDAGTYHVFVDFAHPAQREYEDRPRFVVMPKDGLSTPFESDDWDAVLAFVEGRAA